MSRHPVAFTLNGRLTRVEVPGGLTLLRLLKDELHLQGVKEGCGIGECGACTVHVNGRAVKSCGLLAAQAAGTEVTTIEGLAAADGTLHPMHAAFRTCHGLQCGFCTPVMVMSAVDLVQHHGCANEAQVREALEGNICRCTGYHNIVKAVQLGAAGMTA